MRKFIRQIIAQNLILLGFVRRKNKNVQCENLITSIYFHNPSKKLFEKCVNWLISKNYHFISTDELYEILNGNKPHKKGSVCLTVDDGFIDNLENILPITEKLKIPITIFVSTEPVKNGVFWWSFIERNLKIKDKKKTIEQCKIMSNTDRINFINEIRTDLKLSREAMTKDDVISISKLKNVTIGNHTVNHPITKRCEIDDLQYEITKASEELKSWINKDIKYFAYPNGDFDERETPFLIENNIKLAFTTVPNHINSNIENNNFQIPRFSVNDNGSFSENICKMVGVWQNHIK
jgi:peptidoglycan/xylan/chitin deacetylase (PgdA/CDA1 family)